MVCFCLAFLDVGQFRCILVLVGWGLFTENLFKKRDGERKDTSSEYPPFPQLEGRAQTIPKGDDRINPPPIAQKIKVKKFNSVVTVVTYAQSFLLFVRLVLIVIVGRFYPLCSTIDKDKVMVRIFCPYGPIRESHPCTL